MIRVKSPKEEACNAMIRQLNPTEDRLFPAILRYSLPLIIGSIMQLLFNAIDIMVLGNMASSLAVASVGATAQITALIVNTFIGLATGTSIVLARFLGAQDTKQIRRTVDTALLTAAFFGLFIILLGLFFAPGLLRLIKCPDDCFDGAMLYLRIYFFGAPFILIYNFGGAIIRATGDTKRPLFYIIAAGTLNVVLNILLCLLLSQKVAAVAIATFASQALSAILVVARLRRIPGDCRVVLRRVRFYPDAFLRILRFGFPAAINHALYCIPNLMIQSSINTFGPAAMAGHTAAGSIESIVGCAHSGFGTATVTFMGQNLGAGKRKRVKHSMLLCFLLCFGSALLLGVGAWLLGTPLLRLYVPDDPAAVAFGLVRMRLLTAFLFIGGTNAFLASAVQAFGYNALHAAGSLFSVLGLRVIWMQFIYPLHPTAEMLYLCFTASWTAQMLSLFCIFLFALHRYRTGRLVKI